MITDKHTVEEAYKIARRDGIGPMIIAGLRYFGISLIGYYYYLNYKYQYYKGNACEPYDVFRTIFVDPKEVQYSIMGTFDKWKHMGQIRNGDWDLTDNQFTERALVTALFERFEEDRDWSDIAWVQNAIEAVNTGKSTWNGCRSAEDVEDRCVSVDELFRQIRTEGFKSQSEIHKADIKSILLSGSFDRSKTDIAVAIGRNGEFLFIDGNHRLAIAHMLNLDQIPVRVVVRHEMWQEIREEIRFSDDFNQLSERTKNHIDHPDVQNLVSESLSLSQ